jgi:plastocyanin
MPSISPRSFVKAKGMMKPVLLAAAAFAAAAMPAHAAPARTVTIVIDKMKFGPAPAGVRVGDTILWVNRDFFRHSATAADHGFDLELNSKQAGRIVLRRAGAIAFACKYHPAMKGVIQVAR